MLYFIQGVIYMKISTKGRYALRMMIDLSQHSSDEFVALKDIAERQGISKKYLEQIVPLLNGAGMLSTNRGYQGGYKLARKPKDYTVAEILRVTEGNLAPVACLDGDPTNCERYSDCLTIGIWEGLYKVITEYLSGITLQDIIDKSAVNEGDYSI